MLEYTVSGALKDVGLASHTTKDWQVNPKFYHVPNPVSPSLDYCNSPRCPMRWYPDQKFYEVKVYFQIMLGIGDLRFEHEISGRYGEFE